MGFGLPGFLLGWAGAVWYCFMVTGFVFFYLNSIRLSQRSLALKAAEGVAFDPREILSHIRT